MKKIEINTFLQFHFVSNPTFSPDGSRIAFVVSRADQAENTYKADLHVYDMESKQVRRLTTGGDAKSYVWTEKGTLLFPAIRNPEDRKKAEAGEELTVFYEICPCGGEAKEAFRVPRKVTGIRTLSGGRYLMTSLQDNLKDVRKNPMKLLTSFLSGATVQALPTQNGIVSSYMILLPVQKHSWLMNGQTAWNFPCTET